MFEEASRLPEESEKEAARFFRIGVRSYCLFLVGLVVLAGIIFSCIVAVEMVSRLQGHPKMKSEELVPDPLGESRKQLQSGATSPSQKGSKQ